MKTVPLADAVAMIPDGARIVVGGVLSVGTPDRLMDELVRQEKRDLTRIANDTAKPGVGIGKLIDAKCVRHVIVSRIGTNPETQRQMIAGETPVELVPQGTLIERIRAGVGMPFAAMFGPRCGSFRLLQCFWSRLLYVSRLLWIVDCSLPALQQARRC